MMMHWQILTPFINLKYIIFKTKIVILKCLLWHLYRTKIWVGGSTKPKD